MGMKGSTFDPAHYRRVLANFPTGVAVVTGIDCGRPAGLAVSSFTSVSLDPPMIGFFPGKTSTSWLRIAGSRTFAVNILSGNQKHLSEKFSASGGDKFANCAWRRAGNGAPVLDGAIAWLECEIRSVCEAGDHWFVLGDVHDLTANGEGGPLVFFRGQYKKLDL